MNDIVNAQKELKIACRVHSVRLCAMHIRRRSGNVDRLNLFHSQFSAEKHLLRLLVTEKIFVQRFTEHFVSFIRSARRSLRERIPENSACTYFTENTRIYHYAEFFFVQT